MTNTTFTVGDKVCVTGNSGAPKHHFPIGIVGTVTELDLEDGTLYGVVVKAQPKGHDNPFSQIIDPENLVNLGMFGSDKLVEFATDLNLTLGHFAELHGLQVSEETLDSLAYSVGQALLNDKAL